MSGTSQELASQAQQLLAAISFFNLDYDRSHVAQLKTKKQFNEPLTTLRDNTGPGVSGPSPSQALQQENTGTGFDDEDDDFDRF
jgi:hypothetical protein